MIVPLNIYTFDFNPPKIFFRFLVSPKFFIYEVSPYFLVNSCLTFTFFNEIFQKWIEKYENIPRELSSVGRDIAFYMQGPGFEPRTLHFSTIKLCEL